MKIRIPEKENSWKVFGRRITLNVIFLLFIFVLFYGVNVIEVRVHESVHKQINAYNGIESEINIRYSFPIPTGETVPLAETWSQDVVNYHALHEIISYNIFVSVFYAIFLIVFGISVFRITGGKRDGI